jgi:hypothetical protein
LALQGDRSRNTAFAHALGFPAAACKKTVLRLKKSRIPMRFSRKQYHSSRLLKRQRKILLLRSAAAAVFSVAIVGLLSWLSFNEYISISSIEVEGNSVLTKGEIIALAQARLDGEYFFLFSRRNTILYPRAGIKEAILSAHKRVHEVEVRTTGFTSAKIILKERSPYALWCEGRTVDGISGEHCYFLDTDGYIYANAPDFTGNAFFKYFGALSLEDKSVIGSQFLAAREFKALDAIRLSFSDFHPLGKAVALRVLPGEDAELSFESGGKLLFLRKGKPVELLANVKSIFESDVFEGRNVDFLDYIDLRFGNKVYFKFRD